MKCLIVDDEPIARLGVKRLTANHNDIEIIGMVGSAEEAAEIIATEDVDLIFLDIQMPGITGIEFASRIPGKAMVIFTTAYSEYALDGYEVNAIDYLLKPLDPTRFDRAVEKARNYLTLLSKSENTEETPTAAREHLIVKAERRYVRLKYSDILYIEGLKDYVVIHLEGRRIVTRITLKGIEGLLPENQFMRINKSYIANTDHIDSFDNNDIFIGNQEIAISQSLKDSILEQLRR